MNYSNVFGRTQKQFDMTMNREKSQLQISSTQIPSMMYSFAGISVVQHHRARLDSSTLRVHLFILELSLY